MYYPPQIQMYPDWQGRRAIKSIFASVAGGLWLIGLALPAYTNDDVPGLGAFALGWMLLFDGESFGFIGWLANLPFIVGMFMFMIGRRPSVIRAAMILAIIAGVFSLGALTVDEIPNYSGHANASPYIGCYVYVFANLIFLVGAVVYSTQQSAALKHRI